MIFQYLGHEFSEESKTAHFRYQVNNIDFVESVIFNNVGGKHNKDALDRALFLAGILIGTSYYKTFPTTEFDVGDFPVDHWQADFFNLVYQDGLSQFAFENKLERKDLAKIQASETTASDPISVALTDDTPIVLQSGGKDSLLLAQQLSNHQTNFTPWYVSSTQSYPKVLDTLGGSVQTVLRKIDHEALQQAKAEGALNGHVPVTYIVFSIAVIQAILSGKNTILAAIGHEGEEPYSYIGDLPVRHQWAKIWSSEKQFAEYVHRYISPDLKIGSPLRQFSELKIAELFVEKCWEKYSRQFSSCNIGNYKQGQPNESLGWCGSCPKCANSFLLFAPFVDQEELQTIFNGENLFTKSSLKDTFKGLLGIDDAIKPFECVGETDELRQAYHMALKKSDDYELPFDVPASTYDYNQLYPAQMWATDLIG